VVFFHGVNVVYKHPPFEVYPDPGKAWNFSAADASLMARLGFNVVYKHPPFEVYPDPGKAWNFSAADASLMARLGLLEAE